MCAYGFWPSAQVAVCDFKYLQRLEHLNMPMTVEHGSI
jgi:hypothetical protein